MDARLADLINRTVNTRAKLDVLHYFHDNPFAWESLEGLAQRLYRRASDLELAVADLVRESVLEARIVGRAGPETVYSYCRANSDAAVLTELLAALKGPEGTAVLGAVNAADTVSKARELARRRHLDDLQSRFIAMVSHELRTPLTAMRVLLSTVLKQDAFTAEDARPPLERALSQCDRLGSLIENLLVLSGLHAGGTLDLYLAEVEVPRLVEGVVEQFRRDGVPQDLVVDVADAPPTMVADEYLLAQALAELVSNAVKFSPAHGGIEVRVTTEDDLVRFCVADEGVGVLPRQRERVFEEFYQVEEDASRRAGGLGLGLYMARRIVERHGGTIRVEPTTGPGMTVCFTVPLAGPQARAEG